jgi:hypothetical protein
MAAANDSNIASFSFSSLFPVARMHVAHICKEARTGPRPKRDYGEPVVRLLDLNLI